MKQITKQQIIGTTLVILGGGYLVFKLLIWAIDSSSYL